MGASGWDYVVVYQDDLAAALDGLRRQVFASGEFVSPAEYGWPVPASVEEIVSEPYWEFMGTCGTHSVIDVVEVDSEDGAEQGFGTIRPLTQAECEELFGTVSPDRADYDAAGEDMLSDYVTGGRGTGRSVVLWAEGKPAEIAFWGYSGD